MNNIKKIITLISVLMFSSCTTAQQYMPEKFVEFKDLPENQKLFLDSLQRSTFDFFIKEMNPENGLVKDRSSKDSPASMAVTGFAVPIWAMGAEKGWIKKEFAEELTLTLINFLMNSEQSAAADATGYKGFYYHFLDMKTGKRTWNCELSTVDSGFLFAALIFARNYYNSDSEIHKKIREGIAKILARADWDFFTIKDEKSNYKNGLSMGWSPEEGMIDHCWWGFNEAIVLFVMQAGMDSKDYKITYDRWLRDYDWQTPYPGLGHFIFPPLFGHHYSHMFVDFRGIYDVKNREKGIDYWENTRRATYTQQMFGKENPKKWVGFDEFTWGLSACDGPGSKFNKDGYQFMDYSARGFSKPGMQWNDDGTIAPTAAGGSIPFAPEIAIPTLMNMKYKYGSTGLWGKYGFQDSFNPTAGWVAKDCLGIDQAPIVLMTENYISNFVWKYFMKDKIVIDGLKNLGYSK
jgi:hypothetical protein